VKRILGLILTFLAVTQAFAVTRYVRVDGNDILCNGQTNAAYRNSSGTPVNPNCAYQTPGHVAGGGNGGSGGAPKACGDVFIFVDTNPNGPTRFFSTKMNAGVPTTNYSGALEINPSGATNCDPTNRIRWTSDTGDPNDVIITSYAYVAEAITNVGGSFPNVWKWTNTNNGVTEYVETNVNVPGTAFWPGNIKQSSPSPNLTKSYTNGTDFYYGFVDYPVGAENCRVGTDITADNNGLEAVNARHNTYLCGSGGADGICNSAAPSQGAYTNGVLYFHPQTNAVLADGPQDPDIAPIGNGGNPNTGGFRMMKQVRNKAIFANYADGYEFDHLTFEGDTRWGGDYTYVHDNIMIGVTHEIYDARGCAQGACSTWWRGGFNYFKFHNNTLRGGLVVNGVDNNFDRSTTGMEITDNRISGARQNLFTLSYVDGTEASPIYVARNDIGPGRIWMKPGAVYYECTTGEWGTTEYWAHGLYIGGSAAGQSVQAITYVNFYNNIITTTSDGIGLFYGDHLLFDGTLLVSVQDNGVDLNSENEEAHQRLQHIHFCGTGSDVTFRNTVFYGDELWDSTSVAPFWLINNGANQACVDATMAWPTIEYSLFLHPETSGSLPTIVDDGRTGAACDGGCTLAQAVALGLESATSREIDTGTSGMVDPAYNVRDYRLTVGATQIDEGHATECGNGVCTGGSDDGELCHFRSTDCPSGTCGIDSTACDQGAYEYNLPGTQPPGGGPRTPVIKRLDITCGDTVCGAIIGAGDLPLNAWDSGNPYEAHLCWRKVSDGCIDDEAEYDLATCEDAAITSGGTVRISSTALDATTDYCFAGRISNATDSTESSLTGMLVQDSTGATAPYVDCAAVATVQAYIDDICDGTTDIDTVAATEAVSCADPVAETTWSTSLIFPETCQKTATDVAITFNGLLNEVTSATPGSGTAITVRSSFHTIKNFELLEWNKGVLLDHVTAGPSEVTITDMFVSDSTTSCYEQEDEAGAQGGEGGNAFTNTECDDTPTGYVIGGIDTDVASHTAVDATMTNTECEDCGVGYRFAGGGRFLIAGGDAHSSAASEIPCTEAIYTSAAKSYLRLSGPDNFTDCSWGLKATGGAHVEIDDSIFARNKVAAIHVEGATTRIVTEDTKIIATTGATNATAAYGGLAVAADVTGANVCFGSCSVNLDFTAASPTGSAETSIGGNTFISNREPTGTLRDVHNLHASDTLDLEGNCWGLNDENPAPQTTGLVDYTPISTACGGPVNGGASSYSSTGTVFLSRTLIGGPEAVGAPHVVSGGTSGNTYCGALTPVQTCQSAVTNSSLAASTCASTTGTRTVLCN
jgi:hypothetical protein